MSEKITTPTVDWAKSKCNHQGFLDPYSDFGFKHIFGREPNREFLIKFLNGVFGGWKVITDIQSRRDE